VTEKIEVGPAFQLSAFGTLQHLAIEFTCLVDVVYRERKVETGWR
jgi:hypothetical protein